MVEIFADAPIGVRLQHFQRKWRNDSNQDYWVATINPKILKIGICQHKGQMKTSTVAKAINAIVAINGAFWDVTNGIPAGRVVINGRIIKNHFHISDNVAVNIEENGTIHFDEIGTDPITRYDLHYKNSISTGPFLIKDHQLLDVTDTQRAPRTLLGIDDNDNYVAIVIDGRQKKRDGMTFKECQELGKELNLKYLVNLDGGGSSTMFIKNQGVVNSPSDKLGERTVSNSIIFM